MAAVVVRSSIFRDTDQHNRLLSILNEQRATSRFCDVILKVREEHIFAHSNVLAAASPYFGSFLGLGPDSPRAFCEKSPQVIEIQIDGADAGSGYGDAVRHVVDYMYTCSLELNSVIISQIAEIARIMQVQRVLDYCDRFAKGEGGVHPLDKRAYASPLPELVPSKRVKKTNASTETEIVMFQKSGGIPLDSVPEQRELHSSHSQELLNFERNISLGLQEIPIVPESDSKHDIKSSELNEAGIETAVPSSSEGTSQLEADSFPTSLSLEKVENAFVKEENPIVLMKNEDGSLTGTIAVPFINVPSVEEGLPVLSKEENRSEILEAVDHASVLPEQVEKKLPKFPSTRGRKRGRPGNRGRGRKRKVREVLSDSDPELIQEEDGALGFITDVKQGIPLDSFADATGLRDMKSQSSEAGSSQELPSTSSSATDTTASVEADVKEEPEALTRTRGRKPITSVMASWSSPRRRAGIPRSVFRSDYVMHSLIRRRRQSSSLHMSSLQNDESMVEQEGGEMLEACDALSKTVGGENSPGLESAIKFVCQTCDFSTVSFRLYRQHMKRHPETNTRSYTCTECNFHTTKARQLLQHRKKHLHEDLICSYCQIQLDSRENFEIHLQRHAHSLPYFCHACDMRFKTRTQLSTHLPKHRTEKPFVCQICGNGFKWKHALKSHMITHSATKDHLCDICGFATAHKSQLKAHRLIHTGDTFKCPEPGCSFEATKRQNLKYHMVTHTQEKAHQCEVCGQAFSLIKNMRRHMLLHNETRPFHCSVCTYTTTRYDKLKEHKLKRHGIGQLPTKKLTYGDIANLPPEALTIIDQFDDSGAVVDRSNSATSSSKRIWSKLSPRKRALINIIIRRRRRAQCLMLKAQAVAAVQEAAEIYTCPVSEPSFSPVTPTDAAVSEPSFSPVTPTDVAVSEPSFSPVTPTDAAVLEPSFSPVTPTDAAVSEPSFSPVTPTDAADDDPFSPVSVTIETDASSEPEDGLNHSSTDRLSQVSGVLKKKDISSETAFSSSTISSVDVVPLSPEPVKLKTIFSSDALTISTLTDSATSFRFSSRLLAKRMQNMSPDVNDDDGDNPSTSSPSNEHTGLSNSALRQRLYRQRLKESERWVEYRLKENSRIKICKQNMSAEKKAQAREKARIWLQEYRAKRKAQGLPLNPQKKDISLEAREELKEKNRLRQRKCRSNLTPQKRKLMNLLRRKKRAQRATLKAQAAAAREVVETPTGAVHAYSSSPVSVKQSSSEIGITHSFTDTLTIAGKLEKSNISSEAAFSSTFANPFPSAYVKLETLFSSDVLTPLTLADSSKSLEFSSVTRNMLPDMHDYHENPSTSSPSGPSKAALNIRRYRQRIKEKGQWADYRMKENARIKQYKQNISAEKKAQAREKTRIRQKELRKKRKAQGLPVRPQKKQEATEDKRVGNCLLQRKHCRPLNTQKMVVSVKAREELKEKNRLRQRKHRSKLSPQERELINLSKRKKRAQNAILKAQTAAQ